MKKKILVVSNFFYPEITPRAFRTTNLVKAFCENGHEVVLLLPNKKEYHQKQVEIKNLKIIYGGNHIRFSKGGVSAEIKKNSQSSLRIHARKFFNYFFPPEIFRTYDHSITKALINTKGNFDCIISISQPLSIHISICFAIVLNRTLKKAKVIFEFSDPMFRGNFGNVFPGYFLLGFLFSYFTDYFVVPINEAVKKFKIFKSHQRIKIIPQGVILSDYNLKKNVINEIVTFSYAGRFYKNLRNPKYFFDSLKDINIPFKFILYLPKNDLYFLELIKSYKNKISGEIEIHDFIPREELIHELSGFDFLIDFNNENSAMSPSKLIDYGITQRPILSFNSKTFKIDNLKQFLTGDYRSKLDVDLNKFDIKNITKEFEILF